MPIAEQADPASAAQLAAVLVSFVVVAGLWWCYFDAVNETIRSLLGRDRDRSYLYHVLYGHLGLVAAIVVVAVGFANMVVSPGEPLSLTHVSLLYGGTVFFLACISFMWWRGLRTVHPTRVGAAVLLLMLLPVAARVPAIVAAALVAVVLVGLSAAERRGWAPPTIRRRRSRGGRGSPRAAPR